MKYESKRVIIEAEEYDGTTKQCERLGVIRRWNSEQDKRDGKPPKQAALKTEDGGGPVSVKKGDFIITDSAGSRRSMTKLNFTRKYKPYEGPAKCHIVDTVNLNGFEFDGCDICVSIDCQEGEQFAIFTGPNALEMAGRFIECLEKS